MKRVVLVGVVLSSLLANDVSAQPAPEAVFSVLDAAVADRAVSSLTALPKGVADRRVVGMRLDRLFDTGASRVLLNIDGREWIAAFERLDPDIQGHRAWVGSIDGIPYSHVSFAERSGVVSGLINAVSETFAVRTIVPGVYTIDRVSQTGGELQPLVPQPVPQPADLATSASSEVTAIDDGSLIDVMLLYTPGARIAVGGLTNINAMLAQIISDTNTAFVRSGIATRVRLVSSSEAPLPETTDMSLDLTSLRSNPGVNAARDAAGADLVQLIMNSGDMSACGIGYLLRSTGSPASFPAYSIADYSCVSSYTPTHEMGHNMGSHHSVEDVPAGETGLFSYSFGYKDPARGFRTVMAYGCSSASCPRIPNYSNPSVIYNGGATGTAGQNNAMSISNAATTVANFRQAIGPPRPVTPPGAPTGLTAQVSGLNVTVAWNPVMADLQSGTSAATGYVLQVGSAPGVYDVLTRPVGNTTTVSGSAWAATYFWRVYGTNSAGNGAPSAETQFTLGGCSPAGAPQNFTHVVGAGRVVNLSWNAPATGAGPFSYIIDVGTAPGLTNLVSAAVGGTTGLTVAAPPGTYFVRVRAGNACASTSPPSNERTIVVP